MINRMQHLLDHPHEPGRQPEYYEVETNHNDYVVTLQGALEILRQLDELPQPRWIAFRDLFGARHHIIAAHLNRLGESTPETRRAKRAFERDRDKEDEDDKPFGSSEGCR